MMHYEIKNADLHDLYRNRPCPDPRRRSRSIVWPGRSVNMPEIPFTSYDDFMRGVFRKADAANKRCESFINALDSQRQQHGHQQI